METSARACLTGAQISRLHITLGQLSPPSPGVGKSSTSLHRLGLRRGVLAYVGLQIKL